MRQRFAVEEITEPCLAEDNSRHKGDDDRRYIDRETGEQRDLVKYFQETISHDHDGHDDREVHCQRVKSDVGSAICQKIDRLQFIDLFPP